MVMSTDAPPDGSVAFRGSWPVPRARHVPSRTKCLRRIHLCTGSGLDPDTMPSWGRARLSIPTAVALFQARLCRLCRGIGSRHSGFLYGYPVFICQYDIQLGRGRYGLGLSNLYRCFFQRAPPTFQSGQLVAVSSSNCLETC